MLVFFRDVSLQARFCLHLEPSLAFVSVLCSVYLGLFGSPNPILLIAVVMILVCIACTRFSSYTPFLRKSDSDASTIGNPPFDELA